MAYQFVRAVIITLYKMEVRRFVPLTTLGPAAITLRTCFTPIQVALFTIQDASVPLMAQCAVRAVECTSLHLINVQPLHPVRMQHIAMVQIQTAHFRVTKQVEQYVEAPVESAW